MKIEAKNLTKSFVGKKVLDDISFSAFGGQAFGLLGRNGAGKTTTIRILMDVFSADQGEILLDEKPINHLETRFGYLPEERGLYSKKVVFEQLIYFAELNGMDKNSAKKAIDYWLDRLDVVDYKFRKLDTLSKGNQQKIQLITALVHDPQVIILDEPFSGFDPVNAILLKDVIKEEMSKNKIVFFSSHQMNYIEEFCDNIAIINNGRIAISGDLKEIKRSYSRTKLIVRAENAKIISDAFYPDCRIIDNNYIEINFGSPDKKKTTMQELLSNFNVDEIRVFEPSLNDIFVEYTTDFEKGKV